MNYIGDRAVASGCFFLEQSHVEYKLIVLC